MDLKLKSLKKELESCNDKLEVLDYIYDTYYTYLDDELKEVVNLKYTVIDLNIKKLDNDITELYKHLENYILERFDMIQRDIERLQNKKKNIAKIAEKFMPYVMHSYMLADKNSIYYTPNYKELEKERLDKQIAELTNSVNRIIVNKDASSSSDFNNNVSDVNNDVFTD